MRLAEPLVGEAFGLRSPTAADAEFTVRLRSEAHAQRFLHRVPADVDAQGAWQDAALARADDLPLVVFRSAGGQPEGTIGIYAIDRSGGAAEWGRWVLRPGSGAAAESCLLLFRLAFDVMGLRSVYSRTLTGNRRVVAFHDRMGCVREAEGTIDVDGREEGFIQHRLTAAAWPPLRARLQRLATGVAAHIA